MRSMICLAMFLALWSLVCGPAQAALILKIGEPKDYGQKAILKMEMKNAFTNKIESARAVVFLLDDKGKVVGQETRWIIGGAKDRPALGPDAKTTFNFVIQHDKPFSKNKVTVTKIILEGGRLVNIGKDVQLESSKE